MALWVSAALWAGLCGPARAEVSPTSLAALASAQIVVLGEIHDSPQAHLNQAEALAALRPAAVVFEMIPPERAAAAMQALRDGADLADALSWDASGWPRFALYAPVFAALGPARIYGAEVPRAEAAAAFDRPLADLFAAAARFGLDRDLPQAEADLRAADIQAAHCGALPDEMLAGFVAAQRLRDGVLAEAALRALHETGGPVAILTGNGHARTDWGVPALIARAAPQVEVRSIGQIEADGAGAAAGGPFDEIWITAPPERGDPCAAFR